MQVKGHRYEIGLSKIAVNENTFSVDTLEKTFDSWTKARSFIKKERKKKYWSNIDIKPIICSGITS